MIKNKKLVFGIVFLVLLLIPLVLFFTQCSDEQGNENVLVGRHWVYLLDIGFIARERTDRDVSITRISVARSKEEAYSRPYNVMAMWMPERNIEMVIQGLHWAVSRTEDDLLDPSTGELVRDVLTLEQFGLSYPLTIDDLIDNWENVADLWFSLDRETEHLAVRAGGR